MTHQVPELISRSKVDGLSAASSGLGTQYAGRRVGTAVRRSGCQPSCLEQELRSGRVDFRTSNSVPGGDSRARHVVLAASAGVRVHCVWLVRFSARGQTSGSAASSQEVGRRYGVSNPVGPATSRRAGYWVLRPWYYDFSTKFSALGSRGRQRAGEGSAVAQACDRRTQVLAASSGQSTTLRRDGLRASQSVIIVMWP
jgi:hypothetical protein